VPRKRWKLPRGELVCPRCVRPFESERPDTCPECAQRLKWPEAKR